MFVRFNENKLRAELMIPEREFDNLSEQSVVDFLKSKGITNGIIPEAIQKIITERPADKYITIARGQEPQDGKDTQFILYFKNELKADKPRELQNGTVDYKDLQYVIPVRKGDKLIDIIPPSKGIQGMDVSGYPLLVTDGKEVSLTIGENTALAEDGTHVLALEDGVASFVNREIKISKSLIIDHDVDYSVGNIFFPGDITICGSIIDGFKVVSEGNIFVHKDVVNATVETKGSITVKGGINNKNGGFVKAGKSIEVSNIQFGKVFSGDKIVVEKEIRYSEVFAANQIVIEGDKSYMLGGKIKCHGHVSAYDVGSRKEASKMLICLTENSELLKRIQELDIAIKNNQNEVKRIDAEMQNIEQYLSNPKISSDEYHEFEKIFEEFNLEKITIAQKNLEYVQEKNSILNNLKEKDKPRLSVKNSIFPGVILDFGERKMEVTSEKRRVMIYEESGIVRFRPL